MAPTDKRVRVFFILWVWESPHKGPKRGYYPYEINHQNGWHFPILVSIEVRKWGLVFLKTYGLLRNWAWKVGFLGLLRKATICYNMSSSGSNFLKISLNITHRPQWSTLNSNLGLVTKKTHFWPLKGSNGGQIGLNLIFRPIFAIFAVKVLYW